MMLLTLKFLELVECYSLSKQNKKILIKVQKFDLVPLTKPVSMLSMHFS